MKGLKDKTDIFTAQMGAALFIEFFGGHLIKPVAPRVRAIKQANHI